MEDDRADVTKTQIQVPEELFERLRAFAKRREWSLAETFRRGAELLLQVYPETPPHGPAAWKVPTSSSTGWRGLSAEEMREAIFTDGDPELR